MLDYQMKHARISIILSSLALLAVLAIQINWILQTSKVKEELFNEKAIMVLTRTAEALSADTETCRKMENCISAEEIYITDSLLTNYMSVYDFPINYSFEVKQPPPGPQPNQTYVTADHIYKKRIDEEATQNGLELNLLLPEKRDYITVEMGPLFITSVLLIMIVLIIFWRTTLSLLKEKRIADHTTDFLNNMTHEFKTPLTNISLAGKMISKIQTVKSEDKLRHYSGIILEENNKLNLQVEHMLNLSQLERGEIPLQKTKSDFHLLIKNALKCMTIQIENKQGNYQLELLAEHFLTMVDPSHMTNAICNLIDNAIKYSTDEPKLNIKTFNKDQKLFLTISDKGQGIERQHQKKVFEKYFRVPSGNTHDVKGFGLGLAYVQKIITLHGGSISLQSEKEIGTTFIISLPYG